MRILYRTTHNLAEGAGAIALAAVMAERDKVAGERVAIVLSGGNIDMDRFAMVLGGGTPSA
jgi:threonine dehydratase